MAKDFYSQYGRTPEAWEEVDCKGRRVDVIAGDLLKPQEHILLQNGTLIDPDDYNDEEEFHSFQLED